MNIILQENATYGLATVAIDVQLQSTAHDTEDSMALINQ